MAGVTDFCSGFGCNSLGWPRASSDSRTGTGSSYCGQILFMCSLSFRLGILDAKFLKPLLHCLVEISALHLEARTQSQDGTQVVFEIAKRCFYAGAFGAVVMGLHAVQTNELVAPGATCPAELEIVTALQRTLFFYSGMF